MEYNRLRNYHQTALIPAATHQLTRMSVNRLQIMHPKSPSLLILRRNPSFLPLYSFPRKKWPPRLNSPQPSCFWAWCAPLTPPPSCWRVLCSSSPPRSAVLCSASSASADCPPHCRTRAAACSLPWRPTRRPTASAWLSN